MCSAPKHKENKSKRFPELQKGFNRTVKKSSLSEGFETGFWYKLAILISNSFAVYQNKNQFTLEYTITLESIGSHIHNITACTNWG